MAIAWMWMGCQRLEVDDGVGSTAPGDASAESSGGGSDDGEATTGAPDADVAIPGCTGEPPDVEVVPDTHASCGGVACACDEVCVISDEYCREGGWYEPPAHCASLPPTCAGLEGAQAQACLSDLLCEGGLWVQGWRPERGVLSCLNPGQDCWNDNGDTDDTI